MRATQQPPGAHVRRTNLGFLPALVACLSLAAGSGCAHFLPDTTLLNEGSHGSPGKGWLSNGVRLPDRGRNYVVLRNDAQGGQHWATDRLVGLVERAAATVPRPTGTAPLVVGDMSGHSGGEIPHHQSHRCGRDVDLLFFTRDGETGASVPAPGFVRYNSLGASVAWSKPLQFDVERNWNLVETLVRDPQGGIVRIFIAAWIERLLLTYARTHERAPWVIDRAEQVMVQPGDSLVHDDHMHVRVACTPQERARGCIDGGPLWAWLQKDWEKGDAVPATEDDVLAALDDLPPGVLSGPPLPPEDVPEGCDPSMLAVVDAPLCAIAALDESAAWVDAERGVCWR